MRVCLFVSVDRYLRRHSQNRRTKKKNRTNRNKIVFGISNVTFLVALFIWILSVCICRVLSDIYKTCAVCLGSTSAFFPSFQKLTYSTHSHTHAHSRTVSVCVYVWHTCIYLYTRRSFSLSSLSVPLSISLAHSLTMLNIYAINDLP